MNTRVGRVWMFPMKPVALVGSIALMAASSNGSPQPVSDAPGLRADHLYNGINRPVMIEVTSPRSFGAVTLALLDHEGTALASSVEIRPGRIDLAAKLPAIWQLRRAAYLQLMDGSQPVGSALVLQPMLSRLVPVTRSEPHQMTGQMHSRIVDWIDENVPVPPAPPQTAPENDAATSDGEPASDESKNFDSGQSEQPGAADAAAEETRPIERLCTGLRIYTEHDVVLHTSKGDIRIAMRPDEAPNTVGNLLELTRGGF
jgi:hypothetical protein